MAIDKGGVSAVSAGDLLAQDLRIPTYQRPYSWKPETALQLLNDVQGARTDTERRGVPYVLGAVILHKEEAYFNVVDGQQRLLTLRMILAIIDTNQLILPQNKATPVSRVWTALCTKIGALQAREREHLADFIKTRCQLIRIVTDNIDEAFRVFDSQNYRGKALAPHDLLKAHHLREMRDETSAMKSAVVESWESVKDCDLNRLFSTYLYRIARWSRGERATEFTAQDISIFKGISPKGVLSPFDRYHIAAQTALPMLNTWGAEKTPDNHTAAQSRFQFDVPLLAGRTFFEMVSFMLGELQRVAKQAYGPQTTQFCIYDIENTSKNKGLQERSHKNRYRYVSELYIAAMLYYTNKFGDAGIEEARAQLFSWAYSLRVNLFRVQYQSIDKLARGTDTDFPVFLLLRNTADTRFIHQYSNIEIQRRGETEADLFNHLTKTATQ